jgi:hypothetical protein
MYPGVRPGGNGDSAHKMTFRRNATSLLKLITMGITIGKTVSTAQSRAALVTGQADRHRSAAPVNCLKVTESVRPVNRWTGTFRQKIQALANSLIRADNRDSFRATVLG